MASLTPRLYQLELLEWAKERNVSCVPNCHGLQYSTPVFPLKERHTHTRSLHSPLLLTLHNSKQIIAYLGTGCGKTLISVLLLQARLEDMLMKKQKGTYAIFLAPKVVLVKQQAAVLQRHLASPVRCFIGEMGVDTWNFSQWTQELSQCHVAVMTPAILLNLLAGGMLQMHQIHTIIFDEAHHASGRSPYSLIMRDFYHSNTTTSRRPRILGLTATPTSGSSKPMSKDKLQKSIDELERMLDSKVVTIVDDAVINQVAPAPELCMLPYTLGPLHPELQMLTSALMRAQQKLQDCLALNKAMWLDSAKHVLGMHTHSSDIYYDMGMPTLPISHLSHAIGSIHHILTNMGVYAAALLALDIFKTLLPSSSHHGGSVSSSYTTLIGMLYDLRSMNKISHKVDNSMVEDAARLMDITSAVVVAEVAEAFLAMFCRYDKQEELFKGLEWAKQQKKVTKVPVKALEAVFEAIPPSILHRHMCTLLPPEDRQVADDLYNKMYHNNSSSRQELIDNENEPVVEGALRPITFPLFNEKITALHCALLRRHQSITSPQTNWAGMVFVTQRTSAIILHLILAAIPCLTSWLRSSPIMGMNRHTAGSSVVYNWKKQDDILRRFKIGDINLLVSTSVAEEGVDVRSCQMVLRYDLPPTSQAFVQSRGRARTEQSELVVLANIADAAEVNLIMAMQQSDAAMREAALKQMEALHDHDHVDELFSSECGILDEDEDDEDAPPMWQALPEELVYRVDSTGAFISADMSVDLLQRYVQKLPHDGFMMLRPWYRTERIEVASGGGGTDYNNNNNGNNKKAYQTSVLLPSASAVRQAIGIPQQSHRFAKAAAALEACKLLHQIGALNDHLRPAVLEEENVQQRPFEKIRKIKLGPIKPELMQYFKPGVDGSRVDGSVEMQCYRWQVVEGEDGAVGDKSIDSSSSPLDKDSGMRHLGLLFPQSLEVLGELPDFKVPQLASETNKLIKFISVGTVTIPSEQAWADIQTVSAFMLENSHSNSQVSTCVLTDDGDIDWNQMRYIVEAKDALDKGWSVKDVGLEILKEDSLITTTHYACMYVYHGIAKDKKMTDTFSLQNGEQGTAEDVSFLQYYQSRWGLKDLDPDQPMLIGRNLRKHHNEMNNSDIDMIVIEEGGREEEGGQGEEVEDVTAAAFREAYLPSQLCRLYPLSKKLWNAMSWFSKLLWQLEGAMLAHELYLELSKLDSTLYRPPIKLLRSAITPRAARDELCQDFEILELVGDAFLKYAVGVEAHRNHPFYHEGQLSRVRELRVSNTALFDLALRMGLTRFIRVREGTETSPHQKGKTVSDVVEALIGVFFVSGGEQAGWHLLRRFGVVLSEEEENKNLEKKKDKATCATSTGSRNATTNAPPQQSSSVPQHHWMFMEQQEEDESKHPWMEQVEAVLGYQFKNVHLLREALTHGSCFGAGPSYQRLEYLGDSVLDIIVTGKLYHAYPDTIPDVIYNARSATVNGQRLSLSAYRHGLHQHMRQQSQSLFGALDDFIAEADHLIQHYREDLKLSAEDAWAKLLSTGPFGLDNSSAPKALSDIVESLLGAVYLDSGHSLETSWEVAKKVLWPLPGLDGREVAINPVRALYEKAAKQGKVVKIEMIECTDDKNKKRMRVLVDGEEMVAAGPPGYCASTAKRMAANVALGTF